MYDKPTTRKVASLTNSKKSQNLSQNPLDILICGLNCPISLWPVHKLSVMLNAILLNQRVHLALEMHPSIINQLVRDPISEDNVRSDEFGHPSHCQSNIGSNFHPLGEIIKGN